MRESVRVWLLECVPMCMRSWPLLRRWYWQLDEVEAIRREGQRLYEKFRRDS